MRKGRGDRVYELRKSKKSEALSRVSMNEPSLKDYRTAPVLRDIT